MRRRTELALVAIPVALLAGALAIVGTSGAAPAAVPTGSASPTASSAARAADRPVRDTLSAWAAAPPTIPAGPQADPSWLTSAALATGIPRRALAAYTSAALIEKRDDPGCRLSWNTLAAIGDVESDHGSLNGTPMNAAGEPVGVILGPRLDGGRYDVVPDSDGGRWDQDPTFDRAVGPMQMLPSMWARFGADNSGDGVADPNQIDDAALGSARLLCSWGDLSTADGWTDAVAAYNPATGYLHEVADLAARYAAEVP
jgi:membrane-bound lytic murein transglycosylase B